MKSASIFYCEDLSECIVEMVDQARSGPEVGRQLSDLKAQLLSVSLEGKI